MQWNTVDRAIETEKDTRTERKGVGKLGWLMSDINVTSPPRVGEPDGTIIRPVIRLTSIESFDWLTDWFSSSEDSHDGTIVRPVIRLTSIESFDWLIDWFSSSEDSPDGTIVRPVIRLTFIESFDWLVDWFSSSEDSPDRTIVRRVIRLTSIESFDWLIFQFRIFSRRDNCSPCNTSDVYRELWLIDFPVQKILPTGQLFAL